MVWSKAKTWRGFRSAVPGIALLLVVTVAGIGTAMAATTHYIAANGSDSNNGTTNTTPWQHAPGMPNCSGSCASYTPSAGDQIVFRGGDTWHFGNSGATPYTGGAWNLGAYRGTSGSPVYIGVDLNWFSGGSWSRPILTADNPLTTHPGVWGDTVAACSFFIGSSTTNNMILVSSASHLTLDNFEMTGICQDELISSAVRNTYVEASGTTAFLATRLYIHGWSHVAYSCSGQPSTGQCMDEYAFHGGTPQVSWDSIVIDGSDSDPSALVLTYQGANNVARSVFKNTLGGNSSACHVLHDNLWDTIWSPSDNSSHGNTWLCVAEQNGTNAYYNNIIRNNYPNGVDQPNFWIGPQVGQTDYVFNNVWYHNDAGEDLNIQNKGGGDAYVFNNTFDLKAGINYGLVDCQGGSLTHAINNHFITDGGSAFYGSGTCAQTTNLKQTNAQANAAGYNGSQTYGFSPTSAGSPTVGAGTNEQTAMCGALATAAGSDPTLSDAAIACQSDTRYSCTYDSSNHTVSCPVRTTNSRSSGAWNIGGYEYNSQDPPPNPPTGLAAVVN